MPSDSIPEEAPKGRQRSNAMSVDKSVDKAQIDWVLDFADAGKQSDEKAKTDKKRNEAIASSTVGLKVDTEGLKGLDFKMLMKTDANLKSKAMALIGKQQSMSSLTGTGDAMKEIDTHHDLGKLEAIDGKKLSKAYDSLQKVADSSQELDGKLMEIYCKDLGIEPKDFERLMQARDKKKQDAQNPETRSKQAREKKSGKVAPETKEAKAERLKSEKLEADFEKLRAKVEKEVRDEIWQPLVRQGLIPENFVPDRHSEAARTFEGASDAYEQRLADYTKLQGENAELVSKLNLAKKVSDQTLKVMGAVTDAIPGAEGVTGFVKTGIECGTILSDTAFQVAGQVLQKDDALNIAQSVVKGATGILTASTMVPKEVEFCIDSGLEIALTGGKAIRGIMDGKPEDVLAAIGSGLVQGLNLGAQVSGNPDVAIAAQSAAAALVTGTKAATFIKLLRVKPKPDKDAVRDALADLVNTGLSDIAQAVDMAMKAEVARGEISKEKGEQVSQATQISTDGAGGLFTAAMSKNKAAALAKALGNIANDCCSAYMPAAYGEEVGGILKKALSNGPVLVKAIMEKKPEDALDALAGILATALLKSSKVDGVDNDVAEGLKDAGRTIKALKQEIKGLAAFKKAVEDGDVAGVKKAAAKIVNSLMDPVLEKIDPDALSEDGTLIADDDDDAEEPEEDAVDPESEGGQEMQEQFEAKRRAVIAKADEIIKAGGKPEDIKAAQETRDTAVKELLQRTAFMEEVAASARDFEAMLNSDLSGEDEDDGDTRTLEKLIATIQRDRMIMKMADALVGMGIKAAAAFFAPIGIAMDFKTFAVEASKAVAHLQQLLIWKKNASEARNAVTVQVHTMLNRVGLEEDAVIEHQTKATLALISAIGNIIATAGAHAAPAGVAISAAAKVASASLELALTIKSAAEMEMAWRQYQTALKNPKDRKAARMAMQKNSTLAKYALVWGALNDENPIAQKALKRCGLTDPIIAKEKANVEGVVGYLEVLYNDDPVVLRAVPDMTGWGWEAPKPALTLRCWTSFLSTAQTKGKPKMLSGGGGAITAAFGQLEPAKALLVKAKTVQARLEKFNSAQAVAQTETEMETDPKDKATPDPRKDRRAQVLNAKLEAATKVVAAKQEAVKAALVSISQAAKDLKALDEKNQPYPRVAEWVAAIGALAEIEMRELAGEDVGLEVEKAA